MFEILGSLFINLLKSKLINNNLAIGSHTISFFILLPLSFVYFFILNNFLSLKGKNNIVVTIIFFLLLTFNFYDIFFQRIEFLKKDDAYRYDFYAHNIVKNKTLWGCDDLIYKTNQKVYIDQPGYRYFIALEILIFRDKYRINQIFNIFIYLLSSLILLNILKSYVQFSIYILINLFFIFSSPFITKNILMSNMEWLVLIIYFWFIIFMLKKHYSLAFIFLGLTFFIRQNLILITLFLAFYLSFILNKKTLLIPFFIVFFLPLYHNLYYAKEFRILVLNRGAQGYQNITNKIDYITIGIKVFIKKIIGYIGYSHELNNKLSNFIIALFIPYGTFLLIYLIIKEKIIKKRVLKISIFFITALPTLFIGGCYYPRFECVNLFIALLSIILLENIEKISKISVKNEQK